MLKQRTGRQVAIAGRVNNAITGQGLEGVTVKIIDAPDSFIDVVIFKTKLLGLPMTSHQWRSLQWRSPSLNAQPLEPDIPQIQDFKEMLTHPQTRTVDGLRSFQLILDDSSIQNRSKFHALQAILDHFPTGKAAHPLGLGRSQTASDGWFYLTDLPVGQYRLNACLLEAGLRYNNAYIDVEINQSDSTTYSNQSSNQSSACDRLKLRVDLKPTTIFGKITGSDEREAIGMVKVQLQNSADYTFSSSELSHDQHREWNYQLIGIEPRQPCTTVSVSAKGYPTQQQDIHLETGDMKALDFQLVSQG